MALNLPNKISWMFSKTLPTDYKALNHPKYSQKSSQFSELYSATMQNLTPYNTPPKSNANKK